jgi:hypothetical protein
MCTTVCYSLFLTFQEQQEDLSGFKSENTARFKQTIFDSKPRIWTTILRENCGSRFEAKKAVKFTFKV